MSFRSTAMLFGTVLAMLWVFGLMLAYKKTAYDDRAIMPYLPPSFDVEVDELTIQKPGKEKELKFVHVKDEWTLHLDKAEIRMDRGKINKIIDDIRKVQKNEEAGQPSDPSLQNLTLKITIKGRVGLKKDTEKTWELKIGKEESADKSVIYVASSDRPNRVFPVTKSALDALFFGDVNQLRSPQLFEFTATAVQKVLLKEGNREVELQKKEKEEEWRLIKPNMGLAEYEGAAPKESPKDLPKELLPKESPKSETGGVKGLIDTIRGLRVPSEGDFVAATESNLASYGLEGGKESLRIQVTEDKKDETLLIGKKVKDQYYGRLATDQGMFKINAKQLEPILKVLETPGQLRSRDLIAMDVKKVDQIKLTVTAGKETVVLNHPDEKTWLFEGDKDKIGKEKKASDKAVQAFLEAVQGKRDIQSFLEEDDAAAKKLEAETAGEIVLISGTLDKKDDKNKKEVKLTIGKMDKDAVAVKRLQGGETTRFTITKALAEKLLPASPVLAFLDTALPSYAAEDVTGLTLQQRGKDKLEVVRGSGDKAQRWLFKKAGSKEETFADGVRVDLMLQSLLKLQATKWQQKKVDAKTDDKFKDAVSVELMIRKHLVTWKAVASAVGLLGSLEPAALLAGTSLAAHRHTYEGEPVSILFGKESDQEKDKPGLYAQHTDSDLLFLVAPGIVKTLKDVDLRDRSSVLTTQPLLNAGAVAAGPAGLAASWPLLSDGHVPVLAFDPAKVNALKLEVRMPGELRKLQFERDKDKTWLNKSVPELFGFQLDGDKVNNLLEQMSKLSAARVAALSGPRPKDVTLKMEFVFEGRTITLTVGDMFDPVGYFAHVHSSDSAAKSDSPSMIFLVAGSRFESVLRGTAYFGKERVAVAP